jgi:hypothetical protein
MTARSATRRRSTVTRATDRRRRAYRSGWRRWRDAVARALVDDDIRPLLRLAERPPP